MDRIVCIQGDADRYHVQCAVKKYGKERVERSKLLGLVSMVAFPPGTKPVDGEGNPLHAITREEWEHEKREAKAHGETIYNSCGICLRRIK